MNLRASFSAVALAALATGCLQKNTVSVEPYAVCAMPDECTFQATCSAQFIGNPTLDVVGEEPMWLAVEMHNQLTNNANEAGQGNTHDAHFESYSVSYSGGPGLVPPSTGEIPASGGPAQQVIPAGGTSVIGFDLILQDAVTALAGSAAVPAGPDYEQIVAHVKFKGRYDDNSKWEAEYTIPVRICHDCIAGGCEFGSIATGACPSLFQYPRGAPSCLPVPTCRTATTPQCGGRLVNGDPKALYDCSGGYGTVGQLLQVCSDTCVNGAPDACP